MHSREKIALLVAATILITSFFSGCIFDDLFSDDSTSFSLFKWEICDDEGFPCISLVFYCSNRVTVKLYNSFNLLVDSDYFLNGKKETVFHLSSYGETAASGNYRLIVYDKSGDQIYKKVFPFNGSELSILSCDQRWCKRESYTGDYSLIGLNLLVRNSGDIPIYPYKIDVIMDSSSFSGVVIPEIILPGESKELDCFVYKHGVPGNNTFTLTLEDKYHNILVTDSFSINVVDNVDVEEFKWTYKNSNYKIKIPMVNFLYSYYSNIDRIKNEDYCLYVFDIYDDQYLDLLVDIIMFYFSGRDDVEKINYAASFVQYLDYKKDSETDDSYEYPRYPVETLFNNGGDCEDKAILTACILDNLGYNVALIRLPDHMAVGVNLSQNILPDCEYYTGGYYFLETTTGGKPIGFIPNEYKSISEIDVFPVSSRALLIHHWKDDSLTIFTNTDTGDFVKVITLVENLGIKTARNVKVDGVFYTKSDLELNAKSEVITSIEPGMKDKVILTISIPSSTTWFKTRLYLDGEVVDEKESASSFPT